MAYPKAVLAQPVSASLDCASHDALIIISDDFSHIPNTPLRDAILNQAQVDSRIGNQVTLLVIAGKRVVLAPTGPLNRDYDDVRRYFDAAKLAINEAKASGSVNPAIYLPALNTNSRYQHALEVAYLGACQALWQPLEAREFHGHGIEPITQIGLIDANEQTIKAVNALAAGQYAARDLCGTEPERMAPPRFADYCSELFNNSAVSVDVIDDLAAIDKHYPMLSTVARASYAVERHHPRVVKLEYVPEGEVTRTLMFVGKGLVYDTGGADLKVGGYMAGMSRDKGGAASVAGFMKAVADYQPKGVKVIAFLAVVRNSIGSDCFVPDEIITSREGVRVRIGNTDAEGRLAMGDLLSEMKDLAVNEINPTLFTVATLTGHAARAMGPYGAYVENGPARSANISRQLADCGDLWADGAEVSRSRREDYDFIKPRTLADDVLSSNNAASAVTARGHQFPMAFLAVVGGLDKHGNESTLPLPYVHMDIAGSGVEGGDWQHGKPTAASVSSLFARYCL
ncbi:leucyl aminopeptidase family protein [Pseudoalteromonas sp. Scap03]|uniref:M17 family metallopeptidase n=1 Tax=unclassified Pseudoalteromonas TaxID=194690 RepID=UPI0015BFA50C|nr:MULTISPECIES: leucyl aminopeptidase family protein [unclassified Pseudoalteromonas]NWL15524.1 leucyl aminopeptidase family protein [Pseudoalteromonas sp. Scap03]QLE80670.1 leucyl aminopeptidase family protein [Pseudoalteromonas sp. Scap25]QLE88613.1 leucyl aminopeptidase family protein [Pseudoalteromonas sp. Scap06]